MRPLVADVMTREVVTAPYYASVEVAIDLMLSHNVSGVPIVDDQQRLLGLITEYDVLNLCWQQEDARSVQSCEQFMTRDLKTVQAAASLDIAARIFHAGSLRRLLVVEGDRLAGVISRRDILRSLLQKRDPAETSCAAL